MLNNYEMPKNEESGLEHLNRQLQNMEKMLKKADEYNDTLSNQIYKLKDILKCNQKSFDKLQSNQQDIKEMFEEEGDNEPNDKQLIQHLASIENKLFVTVSLFNDYKSRVNNRSYVQDDDVESKLCNQINVLGKNLLAIGNQFKQLRQHRMSRGREANSLQKWNKEPRDQDASSLHQWSCNGSNQSNKFWSQCKTEMQDMLQVTVLQRRSDLSSFSLESDAEESPIKQLRYQNKIIRRVECILNKAEHFNIRSETLTNVKVLAKMILSALVKRNYEETMSNDKFLNIRTTPDNNIYNPYL